MPGSDLSQPAIDTIASKRSACMTSSTESAIVSRDTSEARIPSCPIEMPSDTAIVANSSPTAPASRTPILAKPASFGSGDVARRDLVALPTRRPPDASGEVVLAEPDGRSIARAPAFAGPIVTSWEWIFFGMEFSVGDTIQTVPTRAR